MAVRIDTSVLRDMKTFGAFDISACFNCGNCTAVCPLSQDSVAFPRRMIRYAQLGQKANVVASRELWLCYYCAECSDTCPRQAEPGEFMASARRFAIAGFDPTTIARRLYGSAAFTWSFLAVVFAVLLAILLSGSPGWPTGRVTSEALLTFVPYETIHWLGIGVGVAAVAFTVATVVNMLWSISRAPTPGGLGLPARRAEDFPLAAALRALGTTVAEVFGQMRYRDCDSEKPAAPATVPLRRWFVSLLYHDGHDRAGAGNGAGLLLQDAGLLRGHLVAGAHCSAPSPAPFSSTVRPSPSSSACARATSTAPTVCSRTGSSSRFSGGSASLASCSSSPTTRRCRAQG